ncbi:MAG: histidine kinase [Gemmatimonadaceae bacterium]|nr:histidine kinase [Gemmatimonadaceae bacterium]
MSAPAPRTNAAPLSLPSLGRTLLANLAVWGAVASVHALSAWSDAVHRGQTPALAGMLRGYWIAYAPFVPFATALYLIHRQAKRPWAAVALVSALYLALELTYQAVLILSDGTVTLSAILPTLRQLPALIILLDASLVLATNAVVYAVVAVSTRRRDAALERRLHEENLRLRLALEEQRLQGLRAQLEPHFLYNALNAIAGLVRSDDRALALTALQQLSRLLRYATTAVAKDWVPLSDEVSFLREYLGLQQLRFGTRLQVRYDGLDGIPDDLESPPLLLQPLAENAIRHGLERSEGTASIDVRCESQGERCLIRLVNSVPTDAPPNPGLGVGLRTLQARVEAAYRGRATLETVERDDRFEVLLILPHSIDD